MRKPGWSLLFSVSSLRISRHDHQYQVYQVWAWSCTYCNYWRSGQLALFPAFQLLFPTHFLVAPTYNLTSFLFNCCARSPAVTPAPLPKIAPAVNPLSVRHVGFVHQSVVYLPHLMGNSKEISLQHSYLPQATLVYESRHS